MLRTCSIVQCISPMQKLAKAVPDLHVLVTIDRASEATGLTPSAIRKRIERGAWLEGHEFSRAPDGRIYIDLDAVARWQRGLRRF